MEPVSLIITALVAGAVAASKDVAEKGVKDAYEGLKALIKRRFADKGKEDDSNIVDKHEKKPDSKAVKALLEEELVEIEIGTDEEILNAAREVLKKGDPEGFKEGKYNTTVTVSGDVLGFAGTNTGTVTIGNVTKGK